MKLLLARLTRTKTGQVARTEEIIDADAILIGRGTDCKLHLPDPRVALHHATIRKGTAGKCTIETEGSILTVDGDVERAAVLKPDQRIHLGPYLIEVLTPQQDIDAAITLELIEPLPVDDDKKSRKVQHGLQSTWLSKRVFSWGLAALVALVFLAWPIFHALEPAPHKEGEIPAITADAAWDPGQLDSSHATFGRDCHQCHQTPFVQVKNDACENCHKTIGWHFALTTEPAKKLHDEVFRADESGGRCAACHRDHKGINALKRQDSPLCTNCHQDLKTRHASVSIPSVANFKTDHPAFKLSMLVPGKTGKDAIVRISQSDKTKLVEKSNLKFPHDVHMATKGVRGPNGKQQMECKNCHVPDETNTRFKPTTMKEHCQDCHSLEFEPKATNRQVPHGSVADVVATVNEFYAQAALLGKPIDQIEQVATRPGDHTSNAPTKNIAWVNQKAETIVTEMMEKRTCFACHEITRVGEGEEKTWQIAPIAVTQHWLPKSRFTHNQHITFECKRCHDVTSSKTSTDIAIPDLANCQSCHSGNTLEKDKARGTCETCHGFHVGGSRAGKPVIPPKMMLKNAKSADAGTFAGTFTHPTIVGASGK